MRTVYTTLDVGQSLIVRLALNDAGIEFFVLNENAASWGTEVGTAVAPFIFQVAEKNLDKAAVAIRKALARIRETPKPASRRKKKP
jgi:hypothetical protein